MTVPAGIYSPIIAAREGWGQNAIGGRDGELYTVTSLAATADPGTFRYAWESPDPLWIRFDGLSGNIDLGGLRFAGGGNKTIDGRDAHITFRGDDAGLGGISTNQYNDFIITGVYFDGQETGWDSDQEGNDLINIRGSTDLFIYRCHLKKGIDGLIDADLWSQRISIVQCWMQESYQAVNLLADNVSFIRNIGIDVRRRFPRIRNGRVHATNCAVRGWNSSSILAAKKDAADPNPSVSELFSEYSIFLPCGTVAVGDESDGGEVEIENQIALETITDSGTGSTDATFKSGSRAKTTVIQPATWASRLDLLCKVEQEAGPETMALKVPRMVAQGNGSGSSITLSSGQAGDFCVIWARAFNTNGSIPADVIPAGFTRIVTVGTGGGAAISLRLALYAKRLDGTETTLAGIAALDMRWCFAVYRFNRPIVAFAANDVAADASLNNPASQTLTVGSAASKPVIAAGLLGCSAAIVSAVATPADRVVVLVSGSSGLGAYCGIHGEFLPLEDYTFDCGAAGGNHRQGIASAYFTFS